MKYQLLLPIVPVWLWQAGLTIAQSPPNTTSLPPCATAPAAASISKTGCGLTDYACICKNSEFVNGLTSAIQKDCKPDEIQKVEKFANDLCGTYGVTVGAAAASSTATPAGTEAPPAPTTNATASATSATGTASGTPAPTQSAAAARFEGALGIGLLGALGAVAAGLW